MNVLLKILEGIVYLFALMWVFFILSIFFVAFMSCMTEAPYYLWVKITVALFSSFLIFTCIANINGDIDKL